MFSTSTLSDPLHDYKLHDYNPKLYLYVVGSFGFGYTKDVFDKSCVLLLQ